MADDAIKAVELDFDPDQLRQKYLAERDKRLRADGEAQYIEIEGELSRFIDEDPYVTPGFTRDPITDEIEVIVIGGGMAGLIASSRMLAEGLTDLKIIEAGGDFGGTWYWNRYPGAQCDIESYIYLPLLEQTKYIPKEKYSYAPEIFGHMRRIGRTFGLYEHALFQTRVTSLDWDLALNRWIVSTSRGDAIKARFVVLATGHTHHPKMPDIPGLMTFKGRSFHTSRWDFAYTGGDNSGNLHRLGDKRVAIIGTGATSVQCVPFLGAYAKELYVFQRTPSSVDLRRNKPTDPDWAKTLEPGWQTERQENFNDIMAGRPFEVDLVDDGWTDIFRKLKTSLAGIAMKNSTGLPPEEVARMAEIADFEKMNEVRARVDAEIADPAVAELLKPWYRQFCKRPCFNDEYLATFNRPNVTLVDTSASQGVEAITESGIIANGVEYQVDCIIFATGFDISTSLKRRIGFEIRGRDGKSLYDHWGRGMRTLHGHSTHGFPNWFHVGAGQNGASVNFASWIGEQGRHVAYIIKQVQERKAHVIEATVEAEDEWVSTIRRLGAHNDEFLAQCTPGYYNNEGKFKEASVRFGGDSYGKGVTAFHALMQEWRDAGDLKGMVISDPLFRVRGPSWGAGP